MTTSRLPALFISHGGGPWAWIDALKPLYRHTEMSLRGLAARLPAQPKAVLVISSHWETIPFSVATSPRPMMEYDYGGFPAHTYQISYPAPGDPALAAHARDLIAAAGLDTAVDGHKGFDHGVFVPLSLMYPDADMPIVMISVKVGYDPGEHIALGRALSPLRDEGVLIVGSGLTYHNMRGFNQDSSTSDADIFTRYLTEAVQISDPRVREERLLQWEHAPRARQAHPREDHLMPLFVVTGAAGHDQGWVLFSENVMKIPMTSYAFGALEHA